MKRVSVRLLTAVPATAIVVAMWAFTPAREQVVTTAAAQAPAALPVQSLPLPGLHHVGLNVLDPAKSQQFYKTMWPQGQLTTFAGLPAYKADMYLLFTKVNRPAPGRWDMKARQSQQQSALWHIGFETQTPTTVLKDRMKAANATVVPMFSSDKDSGSLWRAGEMGYGRNPIVTAEMMKTQAPGKQEEGGYAYFLGPDGELIEVGGGPGQEDLFHHVHFQHEQPWCAAQWYVDHLGFKKQQARNPATREVREVPIPQPCNVPVGPPSWPSMQQQGTLRNPRVTVTLMDNLFSWYASNCQPGRCGPAAVKLVPSRGQVLDHVGLTYPDLDTHVARLRREGVKVLDGIHTWGGTRAAMIEDLDGLAIMLVERKEP
jgi:catechol 2,3-dioxygenase-like lactoylglutathione lyase family enzyme